MEKLQKSVVDVTVLSGEKQGINTVNLKSGKVVSIALYEDGTPSSSVNVKIEDAFGEELHPFVNFKNYKQSGGSYEDSFKPIQIPGNQEIVIKANAKENLTSDFSFQIVFNQELTIQ
ncbi:hypothetical protein [Polaribacter aestuariivivens]|uniref:hypothetical protein n=1 Tax=Polaribacter aestuariivivens TaxID=2304626 RepID=UPI003F499443